MKDDGIFSRDVGFNLCVKLDNDISLGATSEMVALWTHHSTALDGNLLTLPETGWALKNMYPIPRDMTRDQMEVISHWQAINELYSFADGKNPLTPDWILIIHQLLMFGGRLNFDSPIGEWKKRPQGKQVSTSQGETVWHEGSLPKDVPHFINLWIEHLYSQVRDHANPLQIYTDLHLMLVAIQPFEAGNSRMARLLANLPLLMLSEVPIIIHSSKRKRYFDLMGDWAARQEKRSVNEPLITRDMAWFSLRDFFGEGLEFSKRVLVSYMERQANRDARSKLKQPVDLFRKRERK